MPDNIENIIVYLGCTHYGYRKKLLDKYLKEKELAYSL